MRDSFGIPQTLLVLGGSSDLAAATAETLLRRGTRRVILAGRDESALEPVAARLREVAPAARIETKRFDALEVDRHDEFVRETFSGEQDIDMVLIAFGVLADESEHGSDPAATADVIGVNFGGAASVAAPLGRELTRQGQGALVVLSSVAAVRGRPSDYAYAGAKAGLDSFFQGLGDRLADSGVQVMVVRPGFVPTKMTAHRSAPAWSTTPDAVAEQIVRGLERDARVVWAPPRLRWVMAGVRLIPRPLYRRMTAAAERRGRL